MFSPSIEQCVATPGPACIDHLAGGAGLVEAEGVGDDRCRCLQNLLPQRGDASRRGIPSLRGRFAAVV